MLKERKRERERHREREIKRERERERGGRERRERKRDAAGVRGDGERAARLVPPDYPAVLSLKREPMSSWTAGVGGSISVSHRAALHK